MPELTCSLRVGPAISEPVQLADGRIMFAAETPARDAIHVYTLNDPLGRSELSAGVLAIQVATLPGGPTDNGIRAMWPRMAASGSDWQVVYQSGARTRIGTQTTTVDWGTAHGIWPIAITSESNAWGVSSAPPTTSQGVFGYFAGRWWTYDEMRESAYQQEWLKLGTLSHAWTDGPTDFYLFKHDSGTLLRTQSLAEGSHIYRVFDGYAEYPRGCVLQEGPTLVVAVSQSGTLRVAVSPLFEEETKPMAKVSIKGYVAEGTAPFTCGFGYEVSGAVRAWKRVRPVGELTWQEEPVSMSSAAHFYFFSSVTLRDPGQYELSMRAEGVDGVMTETGIQRVITVLAPPAPEPPPVKPPQVITDDDLDALDQIQGAIAAAAWKTLNYTNARCAGQTHDEAMQAYREAVIAAIAALEVG